MVYLYNVSINICPNEGIALFNFLSIFLFKINIKNIVYYEIIFMHFDKSDYGF